MSVNYVAPHQGSGQGVLRARNPDGSVSRLKTPAAPAWAYRVPLIKRISKGAGITVKGVGESDVSDKPGSFADLHPLTAPERRIETEATRRRAAAVYVMDRNIGRLIRQLKRSGEWDRTVFVFWSDNGYFQGEHNRMSGKILAYEPSLRVPMLITGPGMRGGSHHGLLGGQDRYDPIDVVDLTRTLLDVADAAPPHTPDGASLLPVLHGGDTGWTTAVPYEAAMANPSRNSQVRDSDFPRGVRNRSGTLVGVRDGVIDPRTAIGVRTGRWLYVRYVAGDVEIYDLRADPLQWSNLASDQRWMADHAALLADLASVWKQVRYCVGAACRPRLPAGLAVAAGENGADGRRYWRTIANTYGWSGILRG
jgi:arylsulfatase A-like enzyme